MHLRRLLKNSATVAILEQGLFTLGNFVAGLILIFHAGLSVFDEYALAISIATVGHGIAAAVIVEPLAVFGTGPAGGDVRAGALGMVVAIAFVTVAALGLSFLTPDSPIALLAVLVFGGQFAVALIRRLAIVRMRVFEAFLTSLLYLATVTALSYVGIAALGASARSTALAVALAGLLVVGLSMAMNPMRPAGLSASVRAWRPTISYSNKALVSNSVGAVAIQSIYWVSNAVGAPGATGMIKLFEQIAAPGQQIVMALSQLRLVQLRTVIESNGLARLRPRILHETSRFLLLGMMVCLGFLAVGATLAHGWIDLDRSISMESVWLYTTIPVFQALSTVPIFVLRALRQPGAIAAPYAVMLVVVVALGFAVGGAGIPALIAVQAASWLLVVVLLAVACGRRLSALERTSAAH